MLGVCLGHQALGQYFGATVDHAPQLMHGRTSEAPQAGASVFAGVPSPMTATRYHSLTVVPETIPAELEVTARTADGMVMGLAHREMPSAWVQFIHRCSPRTGKRCLPLPRAVRRPRRRRARRGPRAPHDRRLSQVRSGRAPARHRAPARPRDRR